MEFLSGKLADFISRNKSNKYNANGTLIEYNVYNPDGSLDQTDKYDANGNFIEVELYKSDGYLICKGTYGYDAKGNKIEEQQYKPDGSVEYRHTYQYEFDEQGNWITRIEFQDNRPRYIVEREIEYYD